MSTHIPHIVAPVCSPEDALAVIAAGANEIYCGALFDDWIENFGDADFLTRRQGCPSHVRSPRELQVIAQIGIDTGCATTLTLNSRYSHIQQERVIALAQMWESFGGCAVMAGDPVLLAALKERASRLDCHLSIIANCFNASTASFFAELGVVRVVLPRELTLSEMQTLTSLTPDLEYEAIVMNQKCRFIDGFCGFYHAVRYPHDMPALLETVRSADKEYPIVRSLDLAYEGHGCKLAWTTPQGPVENAHYSDYQFPSCAGCDLKSLYDAGVRYFKIAGRGYPADVIVRNIQFLHEAWSLSADCCGNANPIQACYLKHFGVLCKGQRCYYFRNLTISSGNA